MKRILVFLFFYKYCFFDLETALIQHTLALTLNLSMALSFMAVKANEINSMRLIGLGV